MMAEDVRAWGSFGTSTKSRRDALLVSEWRFVLSYHSIFYFFTLIFFTPRFSASDPLVPQYYPTQSTLSTQT